MAKTIKVALVDNTGNCFFSIARYLRDADIDAHLYLMPNTLQHYLPQNATFEDVKQLKWIHDFPMKNRYEKFLGTYTKNVHNEFKKYDLIIACGYSPAFLKNSDIDIDIFIPYGADLRTAPFLVKASEQYKAAPLKRYPIIFIKRFFMKNIKYFLRKAIKEARVILAYAPIKMMQEPLKRLGVNYIDEQMPMLYNNEYVDSVDKFIDNPEYLERLKKSDFIVFNHSRQQWATNENKLKDFDKYLGLKRNDRVIKAFAKFVKSTKFTNPLLVLFEYGTDVPASKKLIKDLNIEDQTLWFPLTPKKVIIELLRRYADFGTDQYRENISDGLSGTAFEVLSSGVPLMGYHAHKDLPENKWYVESPIIDVLTEDDICEVFRDYETNPLKYEKIGLQSKEWFEQHMGQGLADKYIKMINLMYENKLLTHNDKVIKDVFAK